MTAIVVCLYLPILLMASGTALIVEGLNYVADTLLMGGVLLVTAGAMGKNDTPIRHRSLRGQGSGIPAAT